MEIKLEEANNKGKAYIANEQKVKAEMVYVRIGDRLLVISHTEVSEELRGQGISRQLLDKIVEYARINEFKILPLCPYAKSEFEKDSTLADLLYERRKNTGHLKVKEFHNKEYSNGEITVVWQPGKCIHSRVCIKTLPNVYQPNEKPWIKVDNATTDKLKNQINQCPSSALSFYENKITK